MTLETKLTPKQEKFCRNIASGMTQADAYRNSYDAQNMKDETIHQEASRIMRDCNISARVRVLKEKIEEKLIYSAVESFENLKRAQDIALGAVKKVYHDGREVAENKTPDVSNFIKAEELKGKLAGLYVERSELTGKDGSPLIPEIAPSSELLEIMEKRKQ